MERINGNNIIGTAVIPTALAGFYWDEESEAAARKRGEAEERDRMKRDMLNPSAEYLKSEEAMHAARDDEIRRMLAIKAPETAEACMHHYAFRLKKALDYKIQPPDETPVCQSREGDCVGPRSKECPMSDWATRKRVGAIKRHWTHELEKHWLAYCSRVAGKRSEHKVNGEE